MLRPCGTLVCRIAASLRLLLGLPPSRGAFLGERPPPLSFALKPLRSTPAFWEPGNSDLWESAAFGGRFFGPAWEMSDSEEHHFESKADAGASKTYPQQAGTIRKNGYIVIKGRPCKVQIPASRLSLFPLDLVDFGDGPYKRCAVSTSLARP